MSKTIYFFTIKMLAVHVLNSPIRETQSTQIPAITIFRLDRNIYTSIANRGGGVLIAVRDSISCT